MTGTPAARTRRDQQPDTAGDTSRYPAQVRSITWPLLADGYAVTWAPAPAGCSLTLDRRGPGGERQTGAGHLRAWFELEEPTQRRLCLCMPVHLEEQYAE